MGVFRQISVDHIVIDIDDAIGEPASEGQVAGFEDFRGEFEPFDKLCLFPPKGFSGLGAG